ncbi:MAG: GTPase, partial [Pseudomonadota bacterium]
PGLIEGAADGAGLGTRFLGHIERCKVLLHLVDGTAQDVAADYLTVKSELDAYESDLTQKPVVLALNKIDALSEEDIAKKSDDLKAVSGFSPMRISAATNEGVRDALFAIASSLAEAPHGEGERVGNDDPEAWQP